MIALNLNEIVVAVRGKVVLPEGMTVEEKDELFTRNLANVTFDSRYVVQNSLFICLKGERVDGHDFVEYIYERLTAAVVDRQLDVPVPQVIVESTYAAVGAIAAYMCRRSGIKVVGKTSVKELVASVVAEKYNVLKTKGNFNNELGLPRTLFELEPSTRVAVLEMGISHFGEMTRLSAIARPDIAVFTNIENVHTEHLIDRDGVLRAKTELVENMWGEHLVLNGDDDKLASYDVPEGKKAIYYGLSDGCTVTAEDITFDSFSQTDFTLITPIGRIRVQLPAAGKHMVVNALAAAAVGLILGITLDDIKMGIEKYEPLPGRQHWMKWRKAFILDDCYNASPASTKASLNVLGAQPGRRIAILGDMLELGDNAVELHESVGKACAEEGVDILIAVGPLSVHTAEAAKKAGMRRVYCTDRDGAVDWLLNNCRKDDVVLIKASRGMALDKIIELVLSTEKL